MRTPARSVAAATAVLAAAVPALAGDDPWVTPDIDAVYVLQRALGWTGLLGRFGMAVVLLSALGILIILKLRGGRIGFVLFTAVALGGLAFCGLDSWLGYVGMQNELARLGPAATPKDHAMGTVQALSAISLGLMVAVPVVLGGAYGFVRRWPRPPGAVEE